MRVVRLAPRSRWVLPALLILAGAGMLAPGAAGAQQQSLAPLVQTTAADVDAYWQRQFADAGFVYAPAHAILMERRTTTGCGRAWPDIAAFYCPADETVYVGDMFVRNEVLPDGEFAVVQVIAHEWGHHVQRLLGVDRHASTQPPAGTNTFDSTIELQADCLSGTYARDAVQRQRATPSDIDDAIRVLMDVGGDPAGLPQGAQNAHGSGPQRVRLFLQGYYEGHGLAGCGALATASPAGESSFSQSVVRRGPAATS